MRDKITPPICVALDRPNLNEAKQLVDALAPSVRVFKIGLQLFTACGPAAVEVVHAAGREVFLDLKVCDIPNTAAGAVRSATKLGVRFLTVHSGGGREMVRAAVQAATEGGPQLLVVSVLTSLDGSDLDDLGIGRGVSDQVDAMAGLAVAEGAPGLVLAAAEVARVRAAHPGLFLLVPGMRPAWAFASEGDDQARIGTPATALADGADLLVLGRAVTSDPDPAAAMERVLSEIGVGV